MQQLVNSAFTKIMVSVIALIIMSAGFCSMAAMDHTAKSISCMTTMNHGSGCDTAPQTPSCLDFHFGLMEKISHGFTSNIEFNLFISLLAFALLLFVVSSLFNTLKQRAQILKVRLRQLSENVAGIFQDIFGNWLSLFEKRDPSYAFATT
jgi:hypothetical protein